MFILFVLSFIRSPTHYNVDCSPSKGNKRRVCGAFTLSPFFSLPSLPPFLCEYIWETIYCSTNSFWKWITNKARCYDASQREEVSSVTTQHPFKKEELSPINLVTLNSICTLKERNERVITNELGLNSLTTTTITTIAGIHLSFQTLKYKTKRIK